MRNNNSKWIVWTVVCFGLVWCLSIIAQYATADQTCPNTKGFKSFPEVCGAEDRNNYGVNEPCSKYHNDLVKCIAHKVIDADIYPKWKILSNQTGYKAQVDGEASCYWYFICDYMITGDQCITKSAIKRQPQDKYKDVECETNPPSGEQE